MPQHIGISLERRRNRNSRRVVAHDEIVCVPLPRSRTALRNYTSLECVAFVQTTQTAAGCIPRMHLVSQIYTFEVVALDTKLAAF
jgi:hypothetical protein